MNQDIYEPFKIGVALGAELDAPEGSLTYVAVGLDLEGRVNFWEVYSSEEKALHGLRDFALEQLESLAYDAPWVRMSYGEWEKLTGVEFDIISNRQLREWLNRVSLEEVIEAYWNPSENPDFSDSWTITRKLIK